jgi:hypothetical protein
MRIPLVLGAAALLLCFGLAGCGRTSADPKAGGGNEGQAAPAANGSAPAAAEGDGTGGRELAEGSANLDFIVVNRTGQTVIAVDISPRGEESWTGNLLAQRDVPPDERAAATFSRDVEQCLWDVRATYEGGRRQSWPGINLCDTIRVELR